jgi:hypothetical protein
MAAHADLSAERVLTSTTSVTVVDGGAGSTATLQRAALTGDATASANSNALTLATVNANVGSFGTATQVPTVTVNAKGLTTAAANTAIAVPSTQITDFAAAVIALLTDANIPNTITLDNITQITTRSHTSLTAIGTNSHDAIDTHIAAANPHSGSQPLDALLTAIAALVTAADQMIYSTGVDTVAMTGLSAFIRTLLDDADAATARATLGAGTGSGDVVGPASATDLAICIFNGTTGKIIKNSLVTIDASGNIFSAGVAVPTISSAHTLTNKTINGSQLVAASVSFTQLANGTEGELLTWDAFGIIATVAVGTAGHVLTSNGAGAAPTFQAGGGDTDVLLTQVFGA